MMIARWTCEAKIGRKAEALALMKEWQEQIGAQAGIEARRMRTITGSVGAEEAAIQDEFQIENLAELAGFFGKIAGIKMHADWGKRMGDVIVSGSTFRNVYRVVE